MFSLSAVYQLPHELAEYTDVSASPLMREGWQRSLGLPSK